MSFSRIADMARDITDACGNAGPNGLFHRYFELQLLSEAFCPLPVLARVLLLLLVSFLLEGGA